ncbi:hypothetical protein ACNKHV_06475 [Shigella flexneri]
MNIRRKDSTDHAPYFQGVQSRELLSLIRGFAVVMLDAILKHPAWEI